nr:hypothetical protein [Tanacetum cinerariifolium]
MENQFWPLMKLCVSLDAILTLNIAEKLMGLPTWQFKGVVGVGMIDSGLVAGRRMRENVLGAITANFTAASNAGVGDTLYLLAGGFADDDDEERGLVRDGSDKAGGDSGAIAVSGELSGSSSGSEDAKPTGVTQLENGSKLKEGSTKLESETIGDAWASKGSESESMTGFGYQEKDKNEAKRTKPGMEIEIAREIEAEGVSDIKKRIKMKQNGQNRAREWKEREKSKPKGKIPTLYTRSLLLLEAVTPDTYLIYVGDPKRYYWMMGRVLDPTAQRLKE